MMRDKSEPQPAPEFLRAGDAVIRLLTYACLREPPRRMGQRGDVAGSRRGIAERFGSKAGHHRFSNWEHEPALSHWLRAL